MNTNPLSVWLVYHRGAELINRINIREVIRQKEKEKEILKSIKKKMSALQTKQAKLKKNYVEPDDHYTGMFYS